jgi:hypothetical protein
MGGITTVNMQKSANEAEGTTDSGDKLKKRLRSTVAISLGFFGAIAVRQWSPEAARIQMALYTACVVLPLFFGLWANVTRGRFWAGMAAVLGIHILVLYAIRSTFPFRTILQIIPLILIEAFAMFFFMAKLLDDKKND